MLQSTDHSHHDPVVQPMLLVSLLLDCIIVLWWDSWFSSHVVYWFVHSSDC